MLNFLGLNYKHIIYGLVFIFFCVAAYTDIKKREIPILFCIFNVGFSLFIYLYFSISISFYLITALLLGIIYFLYALFVTGSGGDVYMMVMLGFCAGAVGGCISIIVSGIAIFIYWLILRKRIGEKAALKKEFPLAPFVGGGYAVFLILVYAGLINPVY